MIYEYECLKCKEKEDVNKPMADYQREEFCKKCECAEPMQRVFGLGGHQTFGDGYKG